MSPLVEGAADLGSLLRGRSVPRDSLSDSSWLMAAQRS